jgi:hypothetical protein
VRRDGGQALSLIGCLRDRPGWWACVRLVEPQRGRKRQVTGRRGYAFIAVTGQELSAWCLGDSRGRWIAVLGELPWQLQLLDAGAMVSVASTRLRR